MWWYIHPNSIVQLLFRYGVHPLRSMFQIDTDYETQTYTIIVWNIFHFIQGKLKWTMQGSTYNLFSFGYCWNTRSYLPSGTSLKLCNGFPRFLDVFVVCNPSFLSITSGTHCWLWDNYAISRSVSHITLKDMVKRTVRIFQWRNCYPNQMHSLWAIGIRISQQPYTAIQYWV